MASLTIRNLDENLKQRLRVQAAQHGCSMEEEARRILKLGLQHPPRRQRNIGVAIYEEFQKLGGVELDLPSHTETREPPDFS